MNRAAPSFRRSVASHSPARRAVLESLETRTLMSADVASVDGTGNNLAHADWGSAGAALLRTVAAAYADGVSAPGGASRPSARAVSNAVATALAGGTVNDRNLSAFVYAWGQFLDHDMDLTQAASPAESFNVPVPAGDPSFDPAGTGTKVISLTRSQYDPATGTSAANPRQQTNSITAWIDGSVVYGSDSTRAAALRSFAGGKLKTSDGNLLPFNTALLPNANDARIYPDAQLFLAGDVRANENIELTALQTLFVREHNRLADALAAAHPRWADEQIYQAARRTVAGEIQSITYNEFLPALLGSGALDRYAGYDPTVNPGIANEFSTAAFRFGHSMLGDDIEFLDNNGNAVRPEVALSGAFFNPAILQQTGIDPLLKYLASDRAQEIDTHVVDSVRNFLFGPPGSGGLDLVSLNIQRGRDHGLADYNATRAAYGLPRVTDFAQITSDTTVQQQLKDLYGSVDNIDLWVGGLAEDHVAGASVGPLFRRILSDQFERLRDGDRFWYQNQLSRDDAAAIGRTDLSDIIRRNSTVTNVQDNVFVFNVTVGGTVFADANRSGRQDRGEASLSGWAVHLLDDAGSVIDSVVTGANGRYQFTGLDLGTYHVQVVSPSGWVRTSGELDVTATRGTTVNDLDAGFAVTPPRPAPPPPVRPGGPRGR